MAKEKETQEKPKKSKNRIFLFGIPILLLLIMGGGAGAYFLGVFNGDPARSPEASDNNTQNTQEVQTLGPLVEMEDFVVNITHKDSTRFLKIGITLEVEDEKSVEALKKRMPQVADAVLLLAGNRRFEDIQDLQGKMQLKADLLARIKGLVGQGTVTNLYFTDFVVQ